MCHLLVAINGKRCKSIFECMSWPNRLSWRMATSDLTKHIYASDFIVSAELATVVKKNMRTTTTSFIQRAE